jgi:sarcosine oxidase gamma subunit
MEKEAAMSPGNQRNGEAPEGAGAMMEPEFLAAWHSARRLQRDIAASAERPAALSTRDLWKHARRQPGEPVSFAAERAIRSDAGAAARYRRMLSSFAAAHAPMAIAASDGQMTARRVGPYTFEIVSGDGPPILLIRIEEGAKPPSMVELRGAETTLRISLGEPMNGAILLSLDPANMEARQLAALVADPATEIFLF